MTTTQTLSLLHTDPRGMKTTSGIQTANAPDNGFFFSALVNGSLDSVYAEVTVDGQAVAKIYNSGAAEFLGGATVRDLIEDAAGPSLAQKRTDQIAKALGGTVAKGAFAMPQELWESTAAARRPLMIAPQQNLVDIVALNAAVSQAVSPETPPDTLYAEIKVGDRIVANIYNSSTVEFLGATEVPKLKAGLEGPSLAQGRAEQIAEALGGTLVKAATAQTQPEWSRTHFLAGLVGENEHRRQVDAAP